MPFVKGFLRIVKRRPGGGGPVDPGWGIPEGEGPVDPGYGVEGPGEPVDPDYGVDEGLGIWGPGSPMPQPPIHLPKPPPGIWPPPTPGHPIQPLPPGSGRPPSKPIDPDARPEHPIAPGGEYPSHLPALPPGMIWPPPNAVGKFVVLAWIPGMGFKYIVIDAGLKPEHPIAPGGEEPEVDPTRR